MKKFKRLIIGLILAFTLVFQSLGGVDFAKVLAEGTMPGYFDGMNLKVTEAMTDYRVLRSGWIGEHDLSDKYIAIRYYERSALTNYAIEPKVVVDGAELSKDGNKKIYFVGKDGVSNSWNWWNCLIPTSFNGWIVFEAGAFSGEDMNGWFQLRIGMHNDWTGMLDADFGSIVLLTAPSAFDAATFNAAIEAGTTVYNFANTENSTDLNSSNEYDFGTDKVTFTRTVADPSFGGVETAPAATIDGYFDGLNLKAKSTLASDAYRKLTVNLSSGNGVDFTDKYLGIRLHDRSGMALNSIDFKAMNGETQIGIGSEKPVTYLDLATTSVVERNSWWNLEPVGNFNGWIVIDMANVSGVTVDNVKSLILAFGSWSGTFDLDIGNFVIFDKTANTEYATLLPAIEGATVLYSFADGETGLKSDFVNELALSEATATRVIKKLDITTGELAPSVKLEEPVDGWFEGLNVNMTAITADDVYRTFETPVVNKGDLSGKLIAFQIADKTDKSDYQIQIHANNVHTEGAPYYLVDVGHNKITNMNSNWSINVPSNFMGYVVVDFDAIASKVSLAGDVAFKFGFHVAWTTAVSIDFGKIVAIDAPQDGNVSAYTSAFEAGTVLYDFAESKSESGINPLTIFGMGDNVTYARSNKTLTLDDIPGEKAPAYCEIIGDTKVMNFELGEGDQLSSFVANAGGYPDCQYSLVERADDGTGSGNKALHVKVGENNEMEHSVTEVFPRGYASNLEEGAKGLTFYIKNYQQEAFYINLGFDLSYRWYTKWNGNYPIYQLWDVKTGKESIQSGANDGLCIPANFEGYVRIAFDQFVPASWVPASRPWEEVIAEYSTITYMSFDVNTKLYAGFEYDIDNVGVYYGECVTENLFLNFAGTVGFADIMKDATFFDAE